LKYWGLKLFAAAILMIIGYAAPIVWLSITAVSCAIYAATMMAAPLLVAASQNTSFAKVAKQTLTVLGTIATATLISAPVVLFHWYWVAHFSNH
jgi:hypothetical protein